jgi:hypothetical protein
MMIDLATDLKQRFDWAMYVSLEAYEVLPDGKSLHGQTSVNVQSISLRTCMTPLMQSRRR